MENAIILVIVLVVAGIAAVSTWNHFRGKGGGCCGGGGYRPRRKKLDHVVAEKTFLVEGMTCEHCKNRVEEAEKASSKAVKAAIDYIRENYKTVTLTDLSKEFFMNSSYVSQIFKQRTGQNFSEYLTQVRMQKAVQLLATTDEKIYVISAEVGYANTKYFIRAFRSYYRMSPSEYREQNQNT